jgi:hypothetical protein
MADITITEGDTLEVDYSLENTGDGTGTFDPRLLVQGVQEDQDTGITLDPGQTATGTLSWPTESGDAVTDALAEAVTDDTSDSITVTVEDAIPPGTVDNFEDSAADPAGVYATGETISDYYGGDISPYTRQQTIVQSGSTALEATGTTNQPVISSTTGLPAFPQQGDTFRCEARSSVAAGFQGILYATQAEVGSGSISGYLAQLDFNAPDVALFRADSGSFTELASTGIASISASTWYGIEVTWTEANEHTVRLLDQSGTELGSTATVTDGSYTSGGVGFRQDKPNTSDSSYYDQYRIL